MAPLLLDPAPRSLQQSMGCLSLLLLFFTLLHLSIARIFRGNKRGSGLSVFIIIPTYITAFLVFTLVLAVLSLFTLRLFTFPALAGSNNELVLSFLAILSLTYSGLLGCDRRRRLVAVYLASIPCFGNGDHSSSHQLLAAERDPILCFGPQFISSHAKSFDSQTEESSSSQARSSLKTTLTKPAGIVRKKFLEVSCRTAHTWVFGRPKQQAWPINVVRAFRTVRKSFVLIKDHTVQDDAGAALLTPSFLQSRELDKVLIARVVHQAIYRSAPCVMRSIHDNFNGSLFDKFSQLPAVICMLTSDLRKGISKPSSRELPTSDKCYLSEILWSIIVVEVMDFLQYKRTDLPVLTWFTNLPNWLCENDGSTISCEMELVFEAWKAGRTCGKYVTRPCDSECCCHFSFSHTGCGCQCPCVCVCP